MDENTINNPHYWSPYIGSGVGAGVLAHGLVKRQPLEQAAGRALAAGLGTMGLTYPLEYRVRNTKGSSPAIVQKEASAMYTDFYNKTDLDEFVKVAAEHMGNIAHQVPAPIAYDAMRLFEALPEKQAAVIVSSLYDSVEPGMNKVAMEMVAANILQRHKTAAVSLLRPIKTLNKTVKTSLKGAGSKLMTAGEVGATGYSVKTTAEERNKRDTNPYQVGSFY